MKRPRSGSSQYTCSLVCPPVVIAARSFFEIDIRRDRSFALRSQSGRPSRRIVFGERPCRAGSVSKPRIGEGGSPTAYDDSQSKPTFRYQELATAPWREGWTPVVSVACPGAVLVRACACDACVKRNPWSSS